MAAGEVSPGEEGALESGEYIENFPRVSLGKMREAVREAVRETYRGEE